MPSSRRRSSSCSTVTRRRPTCLARRPAGKPSGTAARASTIAAESDDGELLDGAVTMLTSSRRRSFRELAVVTIWRVLIDEDAPDVLLGLPDFLRDHAQPEALFGELADALNERACNTTS